MGTLEGGRGLVADVDAAQPPISDPDVAAAFAAYPPPVRAELLRLRRLIIETADGTEGVGPLDETLKWGQPSYLTSETGSGSTIRIAPTGSDSTHDFALYVICRTDLIDTFRSLFGDLFDYEQKRAVLFKVGDRLPENELRECVALALTYHLRSGDR